MRYYIGKHKHIIIYFAVLSVLVLCCFAVTKIKVKSPVAVIYSDNKPVKKVNLNIEDTFTVYSPKGGYNTISIKDGGIYVESASCPDKVCVRQGSIKDGAAPIVCLPNKMIIRIESDEDIPDAVSG